MKIFITGASGFIGSRLAERFEGGKNFKVHRIDKNAGKENGNIIHDLGEPMPDWVDFKDAVIFHSAASMSENPEELWNSNIQATKNIADRAAENGARRIIFFSSGAVYGCRRGKFMREIDTPDPDNAYGKSKLMGENILYKFKVTSGIPVTVLRLYFPFGPGIKKGMYKNIENSIIEGRTLEINENGSPGFTPVHVSDVLTAVDILLKNEPEGYEILNVCGNEQVTFRELVSIYETQLQKKAVLRFTGKKKGDYLGCNDKIRDTLGWEPEKSIKTLDGWKMEF